MPNLTTSNTIEKKIDEKTRVSHWDSLSSNFAKGIFSAKDAGISEDDANKYGYIKFTFTQKDRKLEGLAVSFFSFHFTAEGLKHVLDGLNIKIKGKSIPYTEYYGIKPDYDNQDCIDGIVSHIALNLTDGDLQENKKIKLSYSINKGDHIDTYDVDPMQYTSEKQYHPKNISSGKTSSKSAKNVTADKTNAIADKSRGPVHPGKWVQFKAWLANIFGWKNSKSRDKMNEYNKAVKEAENEKNAKRKDALDDNKIKSSKLLLDSQYNYLKSKASGKDSVKVISNTDLMTENGISIKATSNSGHVASTGSLDKSKVDTL